MKLKKFDSIVFVGDSITDCERKRPDGEGAPVSSPLGNGYVNLIFAYLHSQYPSYHIRVINQGINGQKSNDILERYDEILNFKTNWVFLMVGINDVWRQFDCPLIDKLHISLDQYRNNIEVMIKKTLENNSKMVLLSPFMLEENKDNEMMIILANYQNVLKELCKKYDIAYIDIQDEFDKLLKHITTFELSRDRIHTNTTGHMVIMRTIMNYLENISTEVK